MKNIYILIVLVIFILIIIGILLFVDIPSPSKIINEQYIIEIK